MVSSTELVYVGNCADLVRKLQQTGCAYVHVNNIVMKENTAPFRSEYDKWRYYPLSFKCSDNIVPVGTYVAGDFMNSVGYIKKITLVSNETERK